MEALVAVGLAGNVVQFIQFAAQLISEAKTIHETGEPSSLSALKSLSKTLVDQASRIKTGLRTPGALPAQEDQHVLSVASACEEAGVEFITHLEKLENEPPKRNLLKSAKWAIRVNFSQRKIDNFATRLGELRSALTLAMIIAFRTNANDTNDQLFSRFDAIDVRNDAILCGIQQLAKSVSQPHPVTLSEKLEMVQEKIDQLLLKIEIPFQNDVMTWLNFRQKHWRYEEVDNAYKATFKWIFEAPNSVEWDDLTSYLTNTETTTPYFINGKAGSGKSTLMKYIVKEPATIAALRSWSEQTEPLILKFFFWNLGTSLQKSATGMLRALLYEILARYPELLPTAFPEMYPNWTKDGSEPTYTELKIALELLKGKSASFLKLCVFIDGIDEFEGDHRDLSDFLRSLVCPHIKLVVSSRPINACVLAFRGCPSLRLQDLTRTDMDLYVHGKLSSHKLMRGLQEHYPEQADLLVSGVREKAEGVFLWVRLVVCILVEGLEDGDNAEDLLEKLDSLPSDLRELYRRMMAQMRPDHQRQASEIFQILEAWKMINPDLSALFLVWALSPLSIFLNMKPGPLERNWSDWQLRQLEAQLRSRCCGLIEVRPQKEQQEFMLQADSYCSTDALSSSKVTYLHRTVAEFLEAVDVREEIAQRTKNTGFIPCLNLARACISMIKTASYYCNRTMITNLETFIQLFHKFTEPSADDIRQYCLYLDEAMGTLRDGADGIHNPLKRLGPWHWPVDLFHDIQDPLLHRHVLPYLSIHTFAARCSFRSYFEVQVPKATQQSLYAIVVQALEGWRQPYFKLYTTKSSYLVTTHERVPTLELLLRNVAGPETKEWGKSIWQYGLTVCADLVLSGKSEEARELAVILLRNAKDPVSLSAETAPYKKFGQFGVRDLFDPTDSRFLRLITANQYSQYASHDLGRKEIIVSNDGGPKRQETMPFQPSPKYYGRSDIGALASQTLFSPNFRTPHIALPSDGLTAASRVSNPSISPTHGFSATNIGFKAHHSNRPYQKPFNSRSDANRRGNRRREATSKILTPGDKS